MRAYCPASGDIGVSIRAWGAGCEFAGSTVATTPNRDALARNPGRPIRGMPLAAF